MSKMKELLSALFEERGLIFLGVVPPSVGIDRKRYDEWLREKSPGVLPYMEKGVAIRRDPELIFPGTKSVIVFGLAYSQGESLKSHGDIAQYARFADYHRVMKSGAKELMNRLQPPGTFRVFVDTAPILERALASQIPGGFIGKNTCFIHEKKGSFLLLGEIFCRQMIEMETASPKKAGCGPCTACQTVCPTGALDSEYKIAADLCLAYWTIEHRGPIPKKFWPFLKDYTFGCDLCQLACPYNQGEIPRLAFPVKQFPELFEIATMSQAAYEEYFGGTPLTRAKRGGLRRNALIAMHVRGDGRLPSALDQCGEENESPVRETVIQIREEMNGYRRTH